MRNVLLTTGFESFTIATEHIFLSIHPTMCKYKHDVLHNPWVMAFHLCAPFMCTENGHLGNGDFFTQ